MNDDDNDDDNDNKNDFDDNDDDNDDNDDDAIAFFCPFSLSTNFERRPLIKMN